MNLLHLYRFLGPVHRVVDEANQGGVAVFGCSVCDVHEWSVIVLAGRRLVAGVYELSRTSLVAPKRLEVANYEIQQFRCDARKILHL